MDPATETPSPKPVAEANPLSAAVPEREVLDLGPAPGGSPEKGKAEEDLAGGMDGGEKPLTVGDFVWAKTKTYPWWPGQIYDPSRASDHIKEAKRKENCVLVAYIGDNGCCAWCEPEQLEPFIDGFQEKARLSSSKRFMGAVQEAVDEIGRFLESDMTCHCLPTEGRAGLEKKVSIANYSPVEFHELLLDVAQDVSRANLLEATMLRSWASAFGKGCFSSGSLEYRPRLGIADLIDDQFAVGDFVWAKTRTYLWWPGQVFDPSQAPDHIKKLHRKENCILVAYFEDDDRYAWCEPNQLKPFIKEFNKKAWQSSSKRFVGAMQEAVDKIGQFLESDLTCHCLPAEARAGLEKHVSVDNYAPGEFHELLLDVARDVSRANLLEATMLRSWVLAYGKGCLSSGSFESRPRLAIADLVDEIDLDAPPINSVGEDQGQEECWITGSGVVEKPEISQEKLCPSRKKRSTENLIAEMDWDAVELPNGKEEKAVAPNKFLASKRKKDDNDRGLDVENGCMKTEEETSFGRQEQKKNKYLSSPCTYLNACTKLSASPKNTELKTLKKATEDSWTSHSGCLTISKCNSDVFQEKEGDKRSPFFNSKETGKSEQKREKKDATTCGDPPALLLTFAAGVSLPSIDNLISTFSKYGDLIEIETLLSDDFGCARVLFATSTDAEKAFDSRYKSGVFDPPVLSYHLCY